MSLTDNFDKLNTKVISNNLISTERGTQTKRYTSSSSTRNLCFVSNDNSRLFLNYSYLLSCKISDDEKVIILSYTTHIVVLKGLNLGSIFYDLLEHIPKEITLLDKRYMATKLKTDPIIFEIEETVNG